MVGVSVSTLTSKAWAQSGASELGGKKPAAPDKPAKLAQDASKASEDEDKVNMSGDDLRYDGQRKVYVLQRNVQITHKDVVLTCDWAEYHEETDTALARGNLLLKDPENTVTGDIINIDFTEETSVVDGNVVIVTQKKKKGAEDKEEGAKAGEPEAGKAPAKSTGEAEPQEEPKTIGELRERKTTIYCTRLRYHYTEGKRYAWLTGPIRAEQKERKAWCDNAEYDGEDGIVKLNGNVRVQTAEGDEFHCPAALVSVEDEWLRAEKVAGVAVRRKKAKQEEQPAPPDAAGKSPPPPAEGNGQTQ